MVWVWVWLSTIIALFSPAVMAASMQDNIIPYQFKAGYLSAGYEFNYLTSGGNYDAQGISSKLPAGYSFKLYQQLIYGRYDFTNRMSFYAELPMTYATSEDPLNKRSKFALNGAAFGVNYDLGFQWLKTILDFRGYASIEKWNENGDVIQTTDGAHKFDSGVHFMKRFSRLQFHSYLGYEYRSAGFSGLLNYQADLAYLGSKLSSAIGFKGYSTIVDDKYTDTPGKRHVHLVNVNGASFTEGSVNPSLFKMFVDAKYSATKAIDVYGSASTSFRGKNVGYETNLSLGFEYFFEPIKKKKEFQYDDQYYQEQTPIKNAPESTEPEKVQFDDENADKEYEKDIENFNRPPEPKQTPSQIRRAQPAPAPQPKPKPKKKVVPHAKPAPTPTPQTQRVRPKTPYKRYQVPDIKETASAEETSDNGLVISGKSLSKKATSTSAVPKSQLKSKKKKKVKITF